MSKLSKVIEHIAKWQNAQDKLKHSRAHRCLECVRGCCLHEGLHLPPPTSENTAIANFRLMLADPGKYGWRQVHSPLSGQALVYFKGCGLLGDGRVAGHIAILDSEKGLHFSSADYPFTKWWAERIVGAFEPLT